MTSEIPVSGAEGLHDAAYLRARHMAVPKKIVESVTVPHLRHDDLYLTRRARGQLSGVEETINSLLRYDSARRNIPILKDTTGYRSGSTDVASQLGVQPYTILPSSTTGYFTPNIFPPLNYGSQLQKPLYSSSPLGYQRPGIEYLI